MGRERVAAVVRLDASRLRVWLDRQLDDDQVVLVLVLADGDNVVELSGLDVAAAARAARLIVEQAQSFADRLATEGGRS
jgi:hypothetical protein